ncbi:MAG: TonB family protein [Sphingomicrobium sp.]
MLARADRFGSVGARERTAALAAATILQVLLVLLLINSSHVTATQARDAVQRLIQVDLSPPLPPPQVPPPPKPAEHRSAPQAAAAPVHDPGGLPGPLKAKPTPSVTPIVALHPTAAPSGGGTGSGVAQGSGSGGGLGGEGDGLGDGGGTELVLIAGEISGADYPRQLGNAGIGGQVSVRFTVQVNGRPTGCTITRSSGIPMLDGLTCRLIEQRFRFRPSTDRFGRPVPDEVDWDHEWVSRGR